MHGSSLRHGLSDDTAHGKLIRRGRAYEAIAHVFFGGRRRRVFRQLASLSGAGTGDRILDVGCGSGYFTRVMAEAVGPSGSALGIDPSPEIIADARRLTRGANCTFSEGIAQEIDAPEGSFDTVVTSLAIHHLPEEERPRAMGEMFRVLRPGGRLLIAEFRPPASRIGRALVESLTGPVMATNPIHLLEPMVRDAGFAQVRSGDVHPWIRYVQARKPLAPTDEDGRE